MSGTTLTDTIPSSPGSDRRDASESLWYRLVLLVFAAFLARLWFVVGPSNPWYALAVAWGTCSLEPVIAFPLIRHAPRTWCRVPENERLLHRLVGVGIFGRLLELSGWNHLIRPMRGFSGKRAGLPWLEQHARGGAIAHGLCLALHMVLAVLALFGRHPWSGALWMLLPAVVLHLYPMLLQRAMILRLQPLLDAGPRDPGMKPRAAGAPRRKPSEGKGR